MTSNPPPEAPASPADGPHQLIDDHLPSLLARAAHALSHEFQIELHGRNVTQPAWRVLACLHSLPAGLPEGVTVTGLAARCLLLQPTMTKLVDRLTREGLVRRGTDPRDRRVVRVGLTPAGADLAADLTKAARRHEALALEGIPPADVAALKATLRGLIARSRGAG